MDATDGLNKNANTVIDICSFIFFLMLGLTFVIIGWYLKRELRLWNEDIEQKIRPKINLAMNLLSFPYIIRALFVVLKLSIDTNHILVDSIDDDTWTAPIVYFIYIASADLLPITAQLASMLVVVEPPPGKYS